MATHRRPRQGREGNLHIGRLRDVRTPDAIAARRNLTVIHHVHLVQRGRIGAHEQVTAAAHRYDYRQHHDAPERHAQCGGRRNPRFTAQVGKHQHEGGKHHEYPVHKERRNKPLNQGTCAVDIPEGRDRPRLLRNAAPALQRREHGEDNRGGTQCQRNQHHVAQQGGVGANQKQGLLNPGEPGYRSEGQQGQAVAEPAGAIERSGNVVAVTGDDTNRHHTVTQPVEETQGFLSGLRTATQQLIPQVPALRMGNNTRGITTGRQQIQLTVQTRVDALQIPRLRAGRRLNQLRGNRLHQRPQLAGTASQNPTQNTQAEHGHQRRQQTAARAQGSNKGVAHRHGCHHRQHKPTGHVHKTRYRPEQLPGAIGPGSARTLVVETEHEEKRQHRDQPGQVISEGTIVLRAPEPLLKEDAATHHRTLRTFRTARTRGAEALLQASFLSAQPLRDTRLQRRGARLVDGFPVLRGLGYFGRFGNFESFGGFWSLGGLHVLQRERVAQLAVLAMRGHLPRWRLSIAVGDERDAPPGSPPRGCPRHRNRYRVRPCLPSWPASSGCAPPAYRSSPGSHRSSGTRCRGSAEPRRRAGDPYCAGCSRGAGKHTPAGSAARPRAGNCPSPIGDPRRPLSALYLCVFCR